MRTIYVVYRMSNGALRDDVVEIEGKVNHLTVKKAIKDKLKWDNNGMWIISWQEEEEFTEEESEEFWQNYLAELLNI